MDFSKSTLFFNVKLNSCIQLFVEYKNFLQVLHCCSWEEGLTFNFHNFSFLNAEQFAVYFVRLEKRVEFMLVLVSLRNAELKDLGLCVAGQPLTCSE